MSQLLGALATQTLALIVYPGLVAMLLFGGVAEIAWVRIATGGWTWPERPRRRPTPVVATVAICGMLAAVQLAAPNSPMPPEDRSVVIAAVALAFTTWTALALGGEFFAEPGLLLLAQASWLLAVLGPAVQPESLRPQVLGNMLVPGLLAAKVACGALYVLCLPALLGMWPMASSSDRRAGLRLNATRILCWFPYCGLFTTLFVSPPSDDASGWLRFFGITALVAAAMLGAGLLLQRRGAAFAHMVYSRVLPPVAAVVLLVVIVTSFVMR